jgi:hypothetical protein
MLAVAAGFLLNTLLAILLAIIGTALLLIAIAGAESSQRRIPGLAKLPLVEDRGFTVHPMPPTAAPPSVERSNASGLDAELRVRTYARDLEVRQGIIRDRGRGTKTDRQTIETVIREARDFLSEHGERDDARAFIDASRGDSDQDAWLSGLIESLDKIADRLAAGEDHQRTKPQPVKPRLLMLATRGDEIAGQFESEPDLAVQAAAKWHEDAYALLEQWCSHGTLMRFVAEEGSRPKPSGAGMALELLGGLTRSQMQALTKLVARIALVREIAQGMADQT